MIKECPVIINNDAVSVVRFDGIDVQFPSVGKNVNKVNVKFENGRYSIVKDVEKNKLIKPVEEKSETVEIKKTEKKSKKTIKKKHDETIVE